MRASTGPGSWQAVRVSGPSADLVDQPSPTVRHHQAAHPRPVLLDERLVRNLGLILVGASLVWRGWIAFQGYFSNDDFVFAYLAAVKPLSWDYLLRGHAGHLMPGAFLITWLLDKVAPLSFPAAMAVVLAFQTATSLALLRLLKLLFGFRAAILIPLTLYLFSPITLEPFVWWAAALNHLPMQLGMVLAVDSLVRYLRTNDRRWAFATVGSVVFALLFFEKSLLIVPFLFLFAAFFFTDGSVIHGLRTVLLQHLRLWGTLAVIGIGYYAVYRATANFEFKYSPAPGSTVNLTGTMIGTSLLPGLVGGPWNWLPVGSSGGVANPPDVGRWLSWEIMVGAILLSVLVRRRAARAWVLLGGYVALDVVLLAIGRLSWIGPVIGQAYRYLADAVIPASLCLGLAFIPLIGEKNPFTPWMKFVVQRVPGVRIVATVTGVIVLNLYLLSAGISTASFTSLWANNTAKAYVANVQSAFASAKPGTVLLDEPVSDLVLSGQFIPHYSEAQIFAPIRGKVKYGSSVTALYGFDSAGHLVPKAVGGIETLPGPLSGCGYAVLPGSQTVLQLPLVVPPLVLTVKVAYLAGADTPLTVGLGTSSVTVPLTKGLNDVYFRMEAGGGQVVLSGTKPGVAVCVDKVTVGQRVDLPKAP